MSSPRNSHFFEIGLVSLFILLYTLAASSVSLNRYWQYNAFWYDFGIFDETVWKLSRFQAPIITQLSPPSGKIVWADHFNPSITLLAPLYWLTDKAEIILVSQAVVVSLSALIAYFIAQEFVRSRLVRISLLVSYLGFVGMQNALYTDVHNIVFALLPFMLMIYAFYKQRWRLYWIFLFTTLGIQENLASVIALFGLFLLLRKPRYLKLGIMTCVIGTLYGIIVLKFIIPAFSGGSYAYVPLYPQVWQEWFTRFIFPTDMKLKTISVTFATFGFLPLASLSILPLVIWHFLERFVLNHAGTRWDLGFHYNAILSPLMYLASFEVIYRLQIRKNISKLLPIWAGLTILLVIFLHRFYLHGPLMLATHPAFYSTTRDTKFIENFTSQIPPTGLLMTQNNLATHFTHRPVILLNKNYSVIKPDVIALDLRPGQNANNFFPLSPDEFRSLSASLSADINYSRTHITDAEVIFTRR